MSRQIRRYAERTKVAVEKSRAEIERLVRSRGATAFGSLTNPTSTRVEFGIRNRVIRFVVPTPKVDDVGEREAEERRLWRCLLLNVKAKFEAVDNGIVSFDEEFLAHIVEPNTGETVGQKAVPQIAAAYNGKMLNA